MKKSIAVLCLIFVTLFSVSVFADDKLNVPSSLKEGFYFSATGGLSFNADADFDSDAGGSYGGFGVSGLSSEADYDEGYLFGGALGYDFGKIRVETELFYRENDFDEFEDVTANGVTINGNAMGDVNIGDYSADGDISALSCMLNGYYDFETSTPLTPYVGAGVGFTQLDVNSASVNVDGESLELVNDDDTVLSYQVSAGFGYDVTRNTTIDVGYRYFATEDPDFDDFEGEYENHSVTFSVRYTCW